MVCLWSDLKKKGPIHMEKIFNVKNNFWKDYVASSNEDEFFMVHTINRLVEHFFLAILSTIGIKKK